MKPVHINLPEPMIEWMKNLAATTDIKAAEHYRRALGDYRRKIERQEQKAPAPAAPAATESKP